MELMSTFELISRAAQAVTPAQGRKLAMEELPTILVIEDEDVIRLLVEDALTEGGFAVDVIASGEEALRLFGSARKSYKALVTDISIDGDLTGWDVAAKVRETNPALPVIYMSGAHAEDWASKGVPNSVMLTKPFAPAQLVTAVAHLLNSVPPPTDSG
jgi:DNA-binding response OmpR family regulator